ncbi:hypothetical protein [Flavobacterium sp.]|uniref:hypothetical protein n=1 Tax=Flavobacterium sp. TaxID=239 RepID=UPI0012220C37|nr:hypothetical protein [Flavobacterium sp.]RZJ71716.1 MAG: hypothetical protein EOO49_08610 [Flavobacterium sp.]
MFQWFTYFTLALGFLPMAIFVFGKRRVSLETRFVFPYIILLSVASAYEFVFSLWLLYNVNLWFSSYLLLEFLTISYFFCRLLRSWKLWCGVALAYVVFFLLLHFQRRENNELVLDGYLSAVTFVATVVLATAWFVRSMKELAYGYLVKDYVFLYVGAILVYLAGTLFLFLFSGLIYDQNHDAFIELWWLNILFSFISRIVFSVAVWRDRT